jgi:ParB family chromosome partitioning protein
MVKKSGLGKGLSSLIPTTKETANSEDHYQEVSVHQLEPNPEQPRHIFDDDQLKELSESIKHNGVIQPIIVTPKAENKGYVVIAGERRWRATKMAGYEKIPAVVRRIEPGQMLTMALLENIQRQELNVIEEAQAYSKLLENNSITQEDLADRLGKSRVTISNTIRLLRLPSPIRNMIQDGKLSFGHARCLVTLENKHKQLKLAADCIDKQWSVRELESRIKAERERQAKPRSSKPDGLKAREKALTKTMGGKVTIAGDGKKGKIAIAYGSEVELERIVGYLSQFALEGGHGG